MAARGIARILACWLTCAVILPAPTLAQPGTVEEIRVQGLGRMTEPAFLHALGIAVGDPYDEQRIRSRFKALWDLHLFEDITIESEKGPAGGEVLVVKIKERPVLSSITYEDNKIVTRTQIEDRLRERKIELGLGKALDLGVVYFAEAAIRDLLSEKGFLDATVKGEVRRITETSRALNFSITPGGKTRIRRITFTGNEIIKDRKLKSQLKLTQERKWYWPWSGKNLYHPVKWDQDVAGLREIYQNRGYLDVELRAPVVEVQRSKKTEKKAARAEAKATKARGRTAAASDETAALDPAVPDESSEVVPPPAVAEEPTRPPDEEPLAPKQIEQRAKQQKKAEERARKQAKKAEKLRSKRWIELTVPVVEGPQYRLGEVTVEGNEVFPGEVLRALVPLREGAVLSNGIVELGTNRINRLYEDRGHLYSTVVRRINRREGENVADVVIVVEEDEPYFVGRIQFRGNSSTQDRVLRRELQLLEGSLFNRTRLDLSRAKINQLGYWQVAGEPTIEPIEDENQVEITFAGEEQGRNEIQIGGGFSGLDGAFFNGVYSTRNFLGRGQVLSTAIQVGGRSSRYQISFQEPWFLGKPYLFGVNLFRRDTDFGRSLSSTSNGGGIVLGKRLTRFSRINLAYNYESVTSTSFATTVTQGDPVFFETQNEISSLTPVFSYSTINNPYRPSRGRALNMSVQVAGGFLGGTTSYVKPQLNYTEYRKAVGRSFFALHGETGLVREFGNDSPAINSSDIEGVPRFQRFWLGGDTVGPRTFETRTITPRRFVIIEGNQIIDVLGDPTGQAAQDFIASGGVPVLFEVGGDRMYLFQSELVVPLNEQADVAFFLDAGDTLFEDTSLDFTTTRVSAGVELRFHLPIFPVPLRLIYGIPIRKLEGDRTSNFTFSIGRSF